MGTSNPNMVPRIQLRDPTGNVISDVTAAGVGLTATITATVPNTGTYYIVVTSGNGVTGTYNLNLDVTPAIYRHGRFAGGSNDDPIRWDPTTGIWYVTTAANTETAWGAWSTAVTWMDVQYADINGDGYTDIVGRVASSGAWYAAISTGSSFTNVFLGAWSPGVTWDDVQVADINGDGKADIIGRVDSSGAWYAGIATGSGTSMSLNETIYKPVANASINWNNPLSTGLISSIAVNEGSGSTYYDAAAQSTLTAVSLSGSPANAAAPAWFTPAVTSDYPWVGPAISNNGATAEAIQTPGLFSINTSIGYSYAFLVDPLDTTTFGRVMDGTGAAVVTSYLNIFDHPGTFSTTWRDASDNAINPFYTFTQTNQWDMVLCTVQQGLGVMYVNGQQVASNNTVNLAESIANQTGQLSYNTTGNGSAMPNANFSGWWIWNNRVLSASDAAALYANPWAMYDTTSPIIALSSTAPTSGMGNQLTYHAAPTISDQGVFSSTNNTLSPSGVVTSINSQGIGDVATLTGDWSNYVKISGFGPTDTEVLALKLDATVNGTNTVLAPNSDAVKTFVADLNTAYGSTIASVLPTTGYNGSFVGDDVLLTFTSGTPGFNPNGYFDFNFSAYANPNGSNGVSVSNVTVTDIATVSEPATGALTLTTVYLGAWSPGVMWDNVQAADINGDGKADIVGRVNSSGAWYAGIATGSGTAMSLTTVYLGAWSPSVTWDNVMVADINGDGKVDIVGRVDSSGAWYAGIATGSGTSISLTTVYLGAWSSAVTWTDVRVADINGDGKIDIVGRVASSGAWYAGIATGSGTSVSLTSIYLGSWSPSVTWVNVQVLDLNGDGKYDVIGQISGTSNWWAGISNGTSFTNQLWLP